MQLFEKPLLPLPSQCKSFQSEKHSLTETRIDIVVTWMFIHAHLQLKSAGYGRNSI